MNCPLTWFQILQLIRDTIAVAGFCLGLVLWRRLDRAQRLMAWWLLSAGVMDSVALMVGCHDQPARRFTIQFWFPMSAPLALGALGALQGTVTRRDIFRLAGLGYVFSWAFLMLYFEKPGEIPKNTASIHTLLLLGAAVITLVRRASLARQDLRHDPGFLLSSALLLFAVPTLFLGPVTRMWGEEHPTWVHRYIGIQVVIATISFLVIFLAMSLTARGREPMKLA